MLFPTYSFAIFFVAVFIGFWYVFRRNLDRKLFLITVSLLFYSFWDWRFCLLLIFTVSVNYGLALLIGTNREYKWRKLFLICSIIFNLIFLGIFKYYTQFAISLNTVLSNTTASFRLPMYTIILPIGISYITFKLMSYIFDVYLCKIPVHRNYLDILLYVSFFPQIASGPIVHAVDFLPQIESALAKGINPNEKPIPFDEASLLILSGLAKKLIFANYISTLVVEPVFSNLADLAHTPMGSISALMALISYSIVIYCDFSGYSDLAIGIALLLGFTTPKNFDQPYRSFSVTEFWKRWHISFSSWLKNYLYFSLGGSRFGLIRTLFALFFTMILGGLWHGATYTFLLWGALQGLALALERGFNYGNKKNTKTHLCLLQIAGTFLFTSFSWLIFRAQNLTEVVLFFKTLFSSIVRLFIKDAPLVVLDSSLNFVFHPIVFCLLVLGLAMHAIPVRVKDKLFTFYVQLPFILKIFFFSFCSIIFTIIAMSGVAPFIYFGF